MFGKKDPLPDPAEAIKIPDHLRMPFFKGKTAPPTTMLSPEERRAQMGDSRRRSRASGFFKGLLAGPVFIIALDLSGEFLVRFLPDSIRSAPPIPLRALMFVVLGAAALLLMILASLARGKERRISAAGVLGLILGALAGSAWFWIHRTPLM